MKPDLILTTEKKKTTEKKNQVISGKHILNATLVALLSTGLSSTLALSANTAQASVGAIAEQSLLTSGSHNAVSIMEDSVLLPNGGHRTVSPAFDHKENRQIILDNYSLAEGEVVSLDINLRGSVAGKRSEYSGAGFMLGEHRVAVFNGQKGITLKTRIDGVEEEYAVGGWSHYRDRINLQIQRVGQKLVWRTDDQSYSYFGKLALTDDTSLPLGLVLFSSPQQSITYSVSNVTKGRYGLDTQNARAALLHPLMEQDASKVDDTDRHNPAIRHLVLNGTAGPVSEEEVQGIEKYLLEYPLPTHNHNNYYFRRRYISYMLEWAYEKTGNIELVKKAVDIAHSALKYRNDNYGQYTLSYGGVGPLWPNFKEVEFYDNGSTGVVPGAGVWAAIPTLAVPANMIARNPELWDQPFSADQTYRDVALGLIEATLESVDYTYDRFKREDNLLKYPESLLREEWRGEVVIINRILPLISGTIPLVEAMEAFAIKREKVDEIDTVNKAMIAYFKSSSTVYSRKDRNYVNFPYSTMRLKTNPDSSEDVHHLGYDSRDFQHLFRSGRYDFTQTDVKLLANTLADIVIEGRGNFNYRLNGTGQTIKNYDRMAVLDALIWYAEFRPDLHEQIVDYALEKQNEEGYMDSNVVWEILKYRERVSS